MSLGHSSVHPLPVTVTVKLQLAVLPDSSVAVQVTVLVPTSNRDPDGGSHITEATAQLSVVPGVLKSTLATPEPTGVSAVVMSDGHDITGGVSSPPVTVTVKLHGLPSSPPQVTVVMPLGKVEPDGGEQTIVPQLPVLEGAG
jgi:hypothetical protein